MGNRVSREIVFTSYTSKKGVNKKTVFSETISEKNIKIYPNPTKGQLKIEIAGWSDSDNGSITIFNSGGAKLMSVAIDGPVTDLDITDYSKGIYLLNINILNEKTTWKIIKE